MKKKGFTLVELLAVIMILGVIMVIAVPSYMSVTKFINKNIFESKVASIKTQATKYALEHGHYAFNVKDLIDDGYLSSDNETGEYYDNYNDRSMVCDVVTISIDSSGEYSSNIIEHDGTCLTKEEINDLYGLLSIKVDYLDSSNNIITNPIKANGFVKASKARLSYTINNEYLVNYSESNIKSVSWSGSSQELNCGSSNIGSCNNYIISTNDTFSNEINLVIDLEISSGDNSNIININSSINVNLDIESPVLFENETYVRRGEESSSRVLTFNTNDGVGSGVSYYAFYENSSFSGTPVLENREAVNGINKATFTKGGTYYLLIGDALGNEYKHNKGIKVDEIDTSKPEIEIFNYNEEWTKNDVIVNWRLKSGNINEIQSYYYTLGGGQQIRLDPTHTSITFSEEMNKTFTIFAVDKSGNASNVDSIQIKIDRSNPTLSFSISPNTPDGGNGWYYSEPTLTLSPNDTLSGVDKVNRCSGSLTNCGTENTLSDYDVKVPSSASSQSLCFKVYDKAGNNKVYCSPTYNVDASKPKINKITLTHADGTLKVEIDAQTPISGIKKVMIKLNNGAYQSNGTGLSKSLPVDYKKNQTVYVKIISNSGRESDEVSNSISTHSYTFSCTNPGSGGGTVSALVNTTYKLVIPECVSTSLYQSLGAWRKSTYDFASQIDVDNDKTKDKNESYVSVWFDKEYKVTFDDQGANSKYNRELIINKYCLNYIYGGTTYINLGCPLDQLKWGFREFEGWYTSKTGGKKYSDLDSIVRDGVKNLYAHWKVITRYDIDYPTFDSPSDYRVLNSDIFIKFSGDEKCVCALVNGKAECFNGLDYANEYNHLKRLYGSNFDKYCKHWGVYSPKLDCDPDENNKFSILLYEDGDVYIYKDGNQCSSGRALSTCDINHPFSH